MREGTVCWFLPSVKVRQFVISLLDVISYNEGMREYKMSAKTVGPPGSV